MRSVLCVVTLAIVMLAAGSATAQNFFWSNLGFEAGAVNGDFVVDQFNNPTGSVYLFYDPGDQNITEGFDLNFSIPSNSSVQFTAAEVFEADITFGNGPDLNDRWGDAFGPAAEVTTNEIDGFVAINVVNGTGIQTENIPGELNDNGFDFVDTLYDTTANAFLIGSLSYQTRNISNSGYGLTTLDVDGLVVDSGQVIDIPFAQLQFFGPVGVPEPGATVLLLIGLGGVISHRHRKHQSGTITNCVQGT